MMYAVRLIPIDDIDELYADNYVTNDALEVIVVRTLDEALRLQEVSSEYCSNDSRIVNIDECNDIVEMCLYRLVDDTFVEDIQ